MEVLAAEKVGEYLAKLNPNGPHQLCISASANPNWECTI